MHIQPVDSYEELSRIAKDHVIRSIGEKNDLLLCAATGSSPTGTYQLLSEEFKRNAGLFSNLRIVKLDEWGGIPLHQQGTCESYLRENLLGPLQIPDSRYVGFKSNPEDPEKECQVIHEKLQSAGRIDLCILGLGMNGHLALNEPSGYLQAHCHVARLSAISLQHQMASSLIKKPTYGLTLGMADILQSKKILILISGYQKKVIVKQFLSQRITGLLPASFLWLHPHVICLIEKETMEE